MHGQRREVVYNQTGGVALTPPEVSAKMDARRRMTELTGVGTGQVHYLSLIDWRDKKLQVEVTSTRAEKSAAATIKMWAPGGWVQVSKLPGEEVPDFTGSYADEEPITVEDFEDIEETLLDRAMVVLA